MSEPITTALRRLLCARPLGDPCWDAMDAVDAVHAALEAENAALRQRVEELDNVGGSMHDGGSITDELREYALGWDERNRVRRDLIAIADLIDAEHESACKRERGEGIRIAEEAALEEMEHEYVKLPVDADGVPIHVGDVVTEHEDGHTFKVDGFMDWDGEWWVFQRDAIQAPVRRCTHHTTDSWERIIADAYDGGFRDPDNEHMRARLVERCRALAGDAE